MRFFVAAACLLFGLTALFTNADAQEKDKEKKEIKLKGLICCPKCELGESKTCATLIVVEKKDKKKVQFHFDEASNKKYHSQICTEAKKGTLTATVKYEGEGDKKKAIIAVKELKFDE
ncbi:MAG: hypothetical protein L0215_24575 [Gemmataceae bacterium]|nr:hypothetical protein [Gemmataceae bacterium]